MASLTLLLWRHQPFYYDITIPSSMFVNMYLQISLSLSNTYIDMLHFFVFKRTYGVTKLHYDVIKSSLFRHSSDITLWLCYLNLPNLLNDAFCTNCLLFSFFFSSHIFPSWAASELIYPHKVVGTDSSQFYIFGPNGADLNV